jgi:hypothetical protein
MAVTSGHINASEPVVSTAERWDGSVSTGIFKRGALPFVRNRNSLQSRPPSSGSSVRCNGQVRRALRRGNSASRMATDCKSCMRAIELQTTLTEICAFYQSMHFFKNMGSQKVPGMVLLHCHGRTYGSAYLIAFKVRSSPTHTHTCSIDPVVFEVTYWLLFESS